MSLSIIDIILLAFICAIVLTLLLKTIGSFCTNPNENFVSKPMGIPDTSNQDIVNMLYKNIPEPVVLAQVKSQGLNCPLDNDESSVDKYIREISFGGMYTCVDPSESKPLDQEKINQYRDDFWDFPDKVNGNSNGGADPVDRMNDIQLSNTNEMEGFAHTNISSVFDNITNGQNKKTGSNGNFYTNVNWNNLNSNDDSVNNGGKFYGDVEGNESSGSYESALVGY